MEETQSSEISVNVYRNKRRHSNQHCDKIKASNLSAEDHNQFYTFGFFFLLSHLLCIYFNMRHKLSPKWEMDYFMYFVSSA